MRQTLETKLESLLPAGDGPFDVIAYELWREPEGGWSVNTPFRIGSNRDRAEAICDLRHRWNVFKANYISKARVMDLHDVGDETRCLLEVDCMAFAEVRRVDL